ncbi:PAS domain-containing protein [Mucilaginibacter sp. SMC90]|uniref:PAS domain-containing protein n=1 Tax=Mucilaginibacter sp. SMC90 TaxID=2929803 RepID=UPI001FB48F3B|nr:PAS domain-containing protein [Mucilaginibacter sp. SMC90]UOE47909.1 PAS domain-containing protein [Mucilaginibacter sp. SMC90]
MYVVASILWITCSDHFLFALAPYVGDRSLVWLSSIKGYTFVSLTGLMLYYLIRSYGRLSLEVGDQYRAIYEANPVPMWIYDESLRIVSVNDAAVKNYGYSRAEFLEKSILDIRPSEDAFDVLASIRRLSDELNQSGTWRHIRKGGAMLYVSITSHKLTFNKQAGTLVMARDMTERTLFEQALEKLNEDLFEEKKKLRETQLISRVGGWVFFPEQRKLLWSEELYNLTGISPEDPRELFDIYIEHIFPEDRPLMISALGELIENGTPVDITHRISALNGETRYIRQLARLEPDVEEIKVVGSMQDISELRLMENERNRHLQNLENTLDSISDAFFALDTDMRIIRVNAAFRAIIDKKHSQIIGENICTLFPKAQNRFYAVYQKALEERIVVRKEDYSLVLMKWIRVAAYPTAEGVAVYFSDITESRIKDIQLKEAVERYELVSQATNDIIYDLDILKDRLIYNTSLTRLIDVPPEEISYNLEWWRSLIHPDDVDEVISSQGKISADRKTNWSCEYRVDCGEGRYRYILDQGYFIYDEDKAPVRLIGAIKDIDELKRSLQENKRQNELLKEVAWLSSHEIRRPVASMLGLMDMLAMAEPGEKDEIYLMLGQCVEEMDAIVMETHRKINAIIKI